MTTALFSVIGLIIGAALQYMFTRHLDYQRHHRNLRTIAYTDYLKAISDSAHVVQRQSPEAREIVAKAADAKTRICLYGSKGVVTALAEFERTGAAMKTDAQVSAFSNLVSEMREDSGVKIQAPINDLQTILFGNIEKAT